MFKIKANKASLILVTRNNPTDLQTAIRNVFDKMDNFNVSDIEYTIDDSAEGTKYSALILGGLDDGYVDVSDDEGGTDTPSPTPEPTTDDTSAALKELQQKQEETNQALEDLRQQIAAILALLQQNSGN